jgi:hypothetical protein
MARFEWLIEQLERDDFRLRLRYDDVPSLSTGLRMSWLTMAGLAGLRRASGPRIALPAPRHEAGP